MTVITRDITGICYVYQTVNVSNLQNRIQQTWGTTQRGWYFE